MPGDTNGRADIFVRDRQTGTTTRVSVAGDGSQANDWSSTPSISRDGRYVTFHSHASNLVPDDTNGTDDVFVHDRLAGATTRISVDSSEAERGGSSFAPSISADGDLVAFRSEAAFAAGDTGGYYDIYVRDRKAGTTERVSVATGGAQANGGSDRPAISLWGRYVAFGSGADLVANDTNGCWDIYAHDRQTGPTELVSVAPSGFSGGDYSLEPTISADGRYVAFLSAATDLVWGDTNGLADAFAGINPCTSLDHISIRGTDRFDTAIKISQALFPAGLPSDSGVVLALGWESYQEALCGAPLAAAYGGPVLLSSKTILYSAVKNELQRLGPDHVFCIGLTDALANAVQDALPGAAVSSIRGTGGSVYDMSRKVAGALETRIGDMSGATAVITMGTRFPDAIAVGPLACFEQWPILLTDTIDGPLHASAAAAIADLSIKKALKAGTYCVLPGGVSGVGNFSGADRYYTNCNVAWFAYYKAGMAYTHVGFTTGDKFPDALAAGPLLARWMGILFLSPLCGPLPACVAGEIAAHNLSVRHVYFIACIEPVIGQVKALLP